MIQTHQPIRAILFDHDGLLVETEWLFFELTRRWAATEGIVLEPDWWAEEYLGKAKSSTELLLELGMKADRVEVVCKERNASYFEALKQPIPLCDGVDCVVPMLAAQMPIGLVSGNTRSAIETVQKHSGLLSLFSVVVTYDDHPIAKPDPGGYLLAAEKLGIPPGDCIAVEDSRRGMQAALNAGMRCVVVPGKLTKLQQFAMASATLESMVSLPECLRMLSAIGGEPRK